jgi:glycosyltransferase A (GT-A) superfamily protein (DUF2064 family)
VGAPLAVVVMAGAARPRPELRELLGAERAGAVQRLLLERATEWGGALGGGRVTTAGEDERVADALARAWAGAAEGEGEGAVVVVWPVLPRWRPAHAEAVLDDLAAGCQVSIAPAFDGGLYLLALARRMPALLALPDAAWDSPDVIGLVLAPANEAGAPAGLVRPERALRRHADVRAALADPLLDGELRVLLQG